MLRLEHTYADQLEGLYVSMQPQGFPTPELRLLNRPLAEALGLDASELEAGLLSGSAVPAEAKPIAQAYAGHQFGQLNPQLGDGRAMLLGEVVDPAGRRFDIQLKGSGETPFSRGGDGRALLDSALREYIISEAMHALGVPTTRALAVVTTGETIDRGDRRGPGAVMTRVASSHLRVGTLEFFAIRNETEKLERLVDYALRRHYPARADDEKPAQALLEEVAERQGELIARWMQLGFVHGVMNTDNFTLSGETIDYGPCAFIDVYDPEAVFSRIDRRGRYAFGNQPRIGAWNMARMAEALLGQLADTPEEASPIAQAALERYGQRLQSTWLDGMRAKLGLAGAEDGDHELVEGLMEWMLESRADYTSTFRRLSASLREGRAAVSEDAAFVAWEERWRARLGEGELAKVAEAMDRVNPLYIARNHLVEEALDRAVQGDLGPTEALVEVLARPFEAQPGRERYAEPAPADFGPYETHCNT
ncbi:MAG: YdiU family protein [Myxococcota bacterium]